TIPPPPAIVLPSQRVEMINIVDPPKPPAALVDRAQEAVQKIGYGDGVASTAAGFDTSLDWARYIDQSVTSPNRWSELHRARPETFYLWYRTGPTTLLPLRHDNSVTRANPPLMTSGMTRTVVDPLGRLSEFVAVPAPAQQDAPLFTNWPL